MRVFVTGATGFIGSAVVRELQAAGLEVTGLARSDAAADGVIHAAFTNVGPEVDFVAACQADAAAIAALGEGLEGSGKPLVVTSGTGVASVPGRAATEDDPANWGPRVAGEEAALPFAGRGVRVSVARFSLSVHDGQADRAGFIPALIALAREKGTSAYIGDGANRWTGVHRLDAARLFRLAVESAPPALGSTASAMRCPSGRSPKRSVPVSACPSLRSPRRTPRRTSATSPPFVGLDNPTSASRTKAMLGWQPEHPRLIEDIEHGGYLTAQS